MWDILCIWFEVGFSLMFFQIVNWLFKYYFLATPIAYGSSQARDETHATVTQTTAVTVPDP